MRKDETLDQFAARMKSARESLDCAEAVVAALLENPSPTRRLENEVLRAVEGMRCRALDFLCGTTEEREERS